MRHNTVVHVTVRYQFKYNSVNVGLKVQSSHRVNTTANYKAAAPPAPNGHSSSLKVKPVEPVRRD